MTIRNLRAFFAAIAIIGALLACGFPTATPAPVAEPPTKPPAQPTATASASATPLPTEAAIQHQIIPVDLPASRSDHAGDYDSSITAEENRAGGGDRFTFERFERPFNADTMDVYFPELDIYDTFLYEDQTWIYGTIQVKDRSAVNSSPYRFAMQIDTEVDGKGDFLVIAENPASTEWTVNGVRVYFDTNSDVGDLTAMFTDEGSTSDGYETMIFDQGTGNDPDTAWVRVSPRDSNTVEFAVKRSVLGNPLRYMVDMWTGHATLDPALFDYSDHYTHEQAGAADTGLPNFYPIKAVFEIDNTCRMAVGFQPTGYEPGVCEQPVARPSNPGPVACTASQTQIFVCVINNGTWNSSNCTCTPPTQIPPPR